MIRILIIVLRGENVGKDLTKSPSQLPERAISVIRLGLHISFFLTGLRRWRSVFLFPTTGYLTRASKSAFCGCRKLFFDQSQKYVFL